MPIKLLSLKEKWAIHDKDFRGIIDYVNETESAIANKLPELLADFLINEVGIVEAPSGTRDNIAKRAKQYLQSRGEKK